ncbi:ankyrin repeat-containing domain protein [Durotheca rogersii]|uniref:ankyrin repeat-containing domain protein n=1 Tax=Durotheca rogersii TaxID=419775 RepID=UPI00221E9EBA|nr:ankyrin repeat-containing domain protein [Durotheca rogersii]KAI5856205.1 ankyrin repeat-containing domain protein [Durotheca rogersii]
MKVDPNAQLEQVGTSPVHQALDTVEASLACDNVAAARASTSIVTDLVIAGADLHELDEHGRTPLIRAAMNEMPSFLVSLMLEFGSSANARDRQKNTALHHAATRALSDETANLDTIQVLVVHGADQSLRNRRGRTPLHEAISFGRLQCAQMLLDYGANLETTDSNGWTPLFGAVVQGSAVLTKLMCDRGAVVDKKDRSGQTALRYAISQGCGEVAEALLEAGADVNLVTKGETPLCQATSKSNLSLLELLLARDADVSLPSPSYCDALPIHIAAMGRDPAILEVLLRAGSPINARDAEGRTPLRWAINDGGGEMVHFLFSKGAAK